MPLPANGYGVDSSASRLKEDGGSTQVPLAGRGLRHFRRLAAAGL